MTRGDRVIITLSTGDTTGSFICSDGDRGSLRLLIALDRGGRICVHSRYVRPISGADLGRCFKCKYPNYDAAPQNDPKGFLCTGCTITAG